jgi:hypothetical protein
MSDVDYYWCPVFEYYYPEWANHDDCVCVIEEELSDQELWAIVNGT